MEAASVGTRYSSRWNGTYIREVVSVVTGVLLQPQGSRSMSANGPSLPSAASAWNGSYLGISCRHRGWRAMAEDDPEQTSARCWISMSRTRQLFDVCRT